MTRPSEDNRVKQIVVGAVILGGVALVMCGLLIGWPYLPGLLGEWIGMMVGVMTTPFFLEASFIFMGLVVVVAINHWRQKRDGDELVYLDQLDGPDVSADLPEHAKRAPAGRIQSPEKELRFTRSGQAALFWVLSAVFAAAAVTLTATASYRDINPELPHPAWALLPLGLAALTASLAVSLTRHAYLILTPLGIEIFPFFRPAQGMRLVVWQEVDEAEVNPSMTRLTLHHDAAKTSGIHLSLKPVRADRRELLAKAVVGRTMHLG